MKISKTKNIKVELTRGGFIELEEKSKFGRLFLPAYSEDYDYGNWNLDDLRDLADAIYCGLKEVGYKIK